MTVPRLFLTRARLREEVPAAALRKLLLPDDVGRRAGAGHRLVWTLFADSPQRERDFLWREADAGVFYLLSQREPDDQHGLFEVDSPKPFAPALEVGDRLAFSLRANATVAKGVGAGKRGKRSDVVMAAILDVRPGARAEARAKAVRTAGRKWLDAQGERSGFAVLNGSGDGPGGAEAAVAMLRTSYRSMRVDHAGPTARLGVIDFDGLLEVRDPVDFVAAIARGFGRAKAFGCGLMLIRRAWA